MPRKFNYPTAARLAVDKHSPEPLHRQIFEQIRQAIVNGQIRRDSRLPPSRQLASELGVSRNTIILVYVNLEAEGYTHSRVGAGTYVTSRLPEDRLPVRSTLAKADDAGPLRLAPRLSHRAEAFLSLRIPSERKGTFDLSPAIPALDLLPFERFATLSARYWRSAPTGDLGYGGTLGLPELRNQIANYLGEAHAVRCSPEQILIVNGTTQCFMLAGHVLADAGDTVVVENPGYTTRFAALLGSGLNLTHVPIDLQGLDSSTFERHAAIPKLVIASPTNQFPLGSTMPMERRLSLLKWADDNNAWILEYDFNSAFHFGGPPLPPLAALDRHNRVVYVGNFNRSFSPALNIAFMVIPSDLIDAFARASLVFSYHASAPVQGAVAEFMSEGHLATHMRKMGGQYRERAQLITHCLKVLLGSTFEVSTPSAGLHLSAIAKIKLDDAMIARSMLAHRIDVPAISDYCMGERTWSGFVFGYGNTATNRIAPALRIFSDAVEAMTKTSGNN